MFLRRKTPSNRREIFRATLTSFGRLFCKRIGPHLKKLKRSKVYGRRLLRVLSKGGSVANCRWVFCYVVVSRTQISRLSVVPDVSVFTECESHSNIILGELYEMHDQSFRVRRPLPEQGCQEICIFLTWCHLISALNDS